MQSSSSNEFQIHSDSKYSYITLEISLYFKNLNTNIHVFVSVRNCKSIAVHRTFNVLRSIWQEIRILSTYSHIKDKDAASLTRLLVTSSNSD